MLLRLKIGFILITILIIALYFKEMGLTLLILLFSGLAIFELLTIFYTPFKLSTKNNKSNSSPYFILILSIIIFVFSLAQVPEFGLNFEANAILTLSRYLSTSTASLLFASIGLLVFVFLNFKQIKSKTLFRFSLFVLCYYYIYLAFYLALGLVEIKPNSKIPIYLLEVIIIVIATDSFAYFFGKLIGGKKLLVKVSPNKTISGLVSGVISSIIASYIYRKSFGLELQGFIVFATIISLSSVIGDLLESAVKRYLQIKDTSTILSAHGGVLDRLDGLLLAIIATKIISFF